MPVHPNSIAALRPIQKGVNPRDILPHHKERSIGLRTKLSRAAQLTTKDIDGITELTYDEKIIIELLRKASGENETSEQGQLRAITEYFNRRHGKPIETQNLNLNGLLNISGRKVSELSVEERATVRAQIETGEVYLLEDGTVHDAEYEEMPNESNSDLSERP